ncbi:MAG: Uma2 family endonuclease [Planctomycetes bacterium]|nr:Uma2 family endonuclease [Planctomycetota bacterium]
MTIVAEPETIETADWKETLARLLPAQGCWSEEEYLVLTESTNQLVEYTDGFIEVLPMPTPRHQLILQYMFLAFLRFVEPRGGRVHFPVLRVRIRPGKFREPDLMLLLDAADPRQQDRYWVGADLALEVVSPDKPQRDLVDKRFDYAEGRIPEYWIVNPLNDTITVYRLEGESYVEAGVYGRGQKAASVLLDGCMVDVNAVFDVK